MQAINAIQLALALVSNIFLLLNMARRVRFTIAQPITIIGWYLSAICIICLCATASGPLKAGLDNPEDYTWSQAFYYSIWAAILYFLCSTLMTVTFWGASTGRFSKDFDLNNSQRTLMLQTILYLMYLLLGALVFYNTEKSDPNADWSYLDAVYWANVTLFTVGFGDLTTTTALSKALLIPYAFIGVISLGLVISSIRKMILHHARRHVTVRMQEKTRKKLVRSVTMSKDDYLLQPINEPKPPRRLSIGSPRRLSIGRKSTDEQPAKKSTLTLQRRNTSELERRKAEFELGRVVQRKALSRRRWTAMATSTGVWLVFWLVGALIFLEFEREEQGWNYYDAFYLCFVTLTTIGYGDRVPKTNGGKSFFVFWSLLALPTMTVLISNAEDTVVKFIRDWTNRVGDYTVLKPAKPHKHHRSHHHRRRPHSRRCPEVVATDPEEGGKSSSVDPATVKRSGASSSETSSQQQQPPLSHAHTITDGVPPRVTHSRHLTDPLPTGRKLHLLIISEVQAVARHLRDEATYHYSFEDWAWCLRLLGEDESSPETHSQAHARTKKQRQIEFADSTGEPRLENGHQKWSWVGHRSPLMSGKDESEWIIEHLMLRLEELMTEGLTH